ncbi:MAG: hypothetical protein AB7O78_02840 [Thermoleophilia bacterium]
MGLLLALLFAAAVAVAAGLVLLAGTSAERALRLAALERRRDHLRRLGEAALDVQRAADRYGRAMAAGEPVREAAVAYQDACGRLQRAQVAGPRPMRTRALLEVLGDPHHPEAVMATRAGDEVVAEVAELQDALEARAIAEAAARPGWRWRASWRLAVLALRARLRRA